MRLYDLLLRAYPDEFRRRYGDAMRQAFRDRRREAAGRGLPGIVAFWYWTLIDVLHNAWLERRSSRARDPRDSRGGGSWWTGGGRDLTYALRALHRQPGLALTVVVTLGLGVGANTAVFSAVRGLVLQPLPYPDSARVVQVWQDGPGLHPATPAAAVEWASRTDLFANVGAYLYTSTNLTDAEPPERIPAARVSGGFFDVLGVAPLLGRALRSADAQPGAANVAVLSFAFWHRHFGGTDDVLRRTVRLGNTTHAVVGVMPPGFEDLSWRGADLWIPMVLDPDNRRSNYRAIARLQPGVEIAAAERALEVRSAELNRRYGDEQWPRDVSVRGLRDAIVGDIGAAVLATQAAAVLVLLIACANLANLLLARSAARRQEFAIRGALGARRARLVRQLLAESVVLALAGGLAGLLVAAWGIDLIVAASPADMPRVDQIRMDPAVLAAGMAIAGATGIVFGLVPAWRLARTGTDEAAWAGNRSATGALRQRPLRWLIVAEVAISVVLLAASGITGRELLAMQDVDVGLSTDEVIAAEVSLPTSSYQTPDAQLGMFERMAARVAGLPGVESAAYIDTLPLSQSWSIGRYRLEEGTDETFFSINYRASPDYLTVAGIPLLQGRGLQSSDADGPMVVLVSRAFAALHWPDGDAVGRRVWFGDEPPLLPLNIVGVVGDVYHTGLDDGPRPSLYFSFAQIPTSRGVLVARTAGDPHDLVGSIRVAVAELDETLPLFNTRTVGDLRGEALAAARLFASLIGLTALLALVLGVVGVYGIVAFNVASRRRETGVRLALGARPADVVRLFLRQGFTLTAIGLAVGLVATLALGLLVFDVTSADVRSAAGTLAVVMLVLAAASLAASYVPARRVLHVDPSDVMRAD